LPQELVDEIIDHLTEETNSLKAFSLVSSSCFHYSRRHLFRSLIVTSNGNPSGFDHFLSYLQDKSDPTHSSYVQSLSLQAPSGLSSSPFPNLKTPLLLGILHHLPHLHHLTIRYTILETRISDRSPFDNPFHLRTLTLENVLTCPTKLSGILSFFSSIEKFRISDLCSVFETVHPDDELSGSIDTATPLQVSSLALPLHLSAKFVKVVKRQIAKGSVSELHVWMGDPEWRMEHFITLHELVTVFRDSLETLHFDAGRVRLSMTMPLMSIIPMCKNLRTVVIDYSTQPDRLPNQPFALLCTLPPSIESVVFKARWSVIRSSRLESLVLEQLLPRMPLLKRVTFDLTADFEIGASTLGDVSTDLKNAFPDLQRQGILGYHLNSSKKTVK